MDFVSVVWLLSPTGFKGIFFPGLTLQDTRHKLNLKIIPHTIERFDMKVFEEVQLEDTLCQTRRNKFHSQHSI